MPYCYACRNSKPATHAHFVDHGILAMRPPKRHIEIIEAQWERMSEEEHARALEEGRQFLARAEADASASGDRSAHTSRGAGTTSKSGTSGRSGKASAQEGEGSPWGLLGVGAIVLGVFGWLFWQGRRATGI
jgi:hypothetical protein